MGFFVTCSLTFGVAKDVWNTPGAAYYKTMQKDY
jgi:hypothetical protein